MWTNELFYQFKTKIKGSKSVDMSGFIVKIKSKIKTKHLYLANIKQGKNRSYLDMYRF